MSVRWVMPGAFGQGSAQGVPAKGPPGAFRPLGMKNAAPIAACRETAVQCVDEAAEGGGFLRVAGQPNDGRGRVGKLDVVVLAVGGEPFEGGVGTCARMASGV